MIKDMQTILKMKYFFRLIRTNENGIEYSMKKPSIMLIKNIHSCWLKAIYSKTEKYFPVFINKDLTGNLGTVYGYVNCYQGNNNEDLTYEYKILNNIAEKTFVQELYIISPQKDLMQYFIQWQRYRKYWWSSITSTPSLFGVNDIKYGDNTTNVDIVARFPNTTQTVENISIGSSGNLNNKYYLKCSMNLQDALYILMLDARNNNNTEEYLRLHRKMAPYKISFALQSDDQNQRNTLKKLAELLQHKLEWNQTPSWLPDFQLPMDLQIKENLLLGVPYTAVISEATLKTGIFHLLNSSTMLKEEVHIADLEQYAKLIC